MKVAAELPLVGVSACLLGQKVRYDGRDKYTSIIDEELSKYCQLKAVCPEVEIGLGVPREKIRLTQTKSGIKVVKADDVSADVTRPLMNFALQFVKKYPLSGLVLQDKSPSCGVDNAILFSENGEKIGLSSGLFAKTVINLMPGLIVIQASQLKNINDIERFVRHLS